jgi:Ricin-type beta-trefoil lectin domain
MLRENTRMSAAIRLSAMVVVASTGLALGMSARAVAGGPIVGVSGKCVDISGANTANGTRVQLWTCNDTGAQQWNIAGDGAIHALGECLDSGGGTANGTRVQLWDCNGTGAQQWVAPTLNKLVNPQSGRCLDATGGNTADGTPLQIFDCNGSSAQSWSPPPGGPTATLYRLSMDLPIPAGNPIELLRSAPFFLHQGNQFVDDARLESRRVFGQANVRSSTSSEIAYSADVQCGDATTLNQVGPAYWSSKNQTSTSGLILTPSLLFTAPQDGFYVCRLQAAGAAKQTALMAGTWLRVDNTNDLSAQQWHNPDCDSEGTLSTCTYLGGTGHSRRVSICDPNRVFDIPNSDHAYLLDDDCTPRTLWTAASNILSADVTATAELTTCYEGTGSCVSTEWGGHGVGSTISSHLEAVQFDAAGNVCNVTATASQVDVIDANTHHYNISYHLANVPVLTSCGSLAICTTTARCRQFLVRIAVSWSSGNPVKIDGERHDDGSEQQETAAFIVGSTDPVTTPVIRRLVAPNVLSYDEASARTAIAAAGLPVGSVTHTANCFDPDTVLIQNPSEFSVVPAGTPVNLRICNASHGDGGGPPL